jgi:DNA invertase Pin-like site-specific DNA recombinase
MVVAYIRVSSKSQDLAMQRDAIGRVARARGDRIKTWYAEKTTGVNERPELTRLREDIRGGRVTKVYVYRLDRLSRGGILEVLNLVHEFRDHGCKLETIADGFSLEGPASDVILAVFAWVAEMERAAIRERMSAARIRVEKAGGRWGRPRKVGPGDVKRMKELQKQDRSVRSIAMALKIPRSTVSEYLSGKPTRKRSVLSNGKGALQASGK